VSRSKTQEHQGNKFRPRVGFRTLTTLVTAGLIAGTVLVVSQTFERQLRNTLLAQAETQLLLEARNLAVLSGDALLSDFPELTLVPLVLEIDRSRPDLDGIVIVDHEGLIQGHVDPRQVGQPWTPLAEAQFAVGRDFLIPGESLVLGADRIRAMTPIRHHTEGVIGRVCIDLDKGFIESRIREARRPLLMVASLLLVFTIALMMGLLSLLFRPLESIEQGLVRIGQGDLDTPLPLTGSIELRRLAKTLNEMAAQLQTSQALAAAREQEIIETQREVIITLGDVVESRSRETANHTRRVGLMSRELALLIGMDETEAELLRLASPMHDIGKIAIPDRILNKPGKLTDEERVLMQTHAVIGYEILKGSKRPIMQAAAVIARDHHERWDGQGYPNKTAGEDIHLYGRITALVDVFDALAGDRVYRKAMPLDKILTIIEEGRGTHFEPRLVDIFMSNLSRFLSVAERFADKTRETPADAQPATSPVVRETEPATS